LLPRLDYTLRFPLEGTWEEADAGRVLLVGPCVGQDGRSLIYAVRSSGITLWDSATGEMVGAPESPAIDSRSLCLHYMSPEGRTLVQVFGTGDGDATRVIDPVTATVCAEVVCSILTLHFVPDVGVVYTHATEGQGLITRRLDHADENYASLVSFFLLFPLCGDVE
jgi:hypothetical protein